MSSPNPRVEQLRRMIQDSTARKAIISLATALRFEAQDSDGAYRLYLHHLAKELDAIGYQELAREMEP